MTSFSDIFKGGKNLITLLAAFTSNKPFWKAKSVITEFFSMHSTPMIKPLPLTPEILL